MRIEIIGADVSSIGGVGLTCAMSVKSAGRPCVFRAGAVIGVFDAVATIDITATMVDGEEKSIGYIASIDRIGMCIDAALGVGAYSRTIIDPSVTIAGRNCLGCSIGRL